MGLYPKGAPAACYLKRAGIASRKPFVLSYFGARGALWVACLQAHGATHEAALSGRRRQASLPATETKGSEIDSSVLA